MDYNAPPRTQPSLWLQWVVTKDRLHIKWDNGDKFYNYVDWIEYIINKILKPRGYALNGKVRWKGEEEEDIGRIYVTNNKIKVVGGEFDDLSELVEEKLEKIENERQRTE